MSVELQAPPTCGRSEDLVRRVELRSDRIRFVRQADATRRLEAVLAPRRGSVTATLALVQPNGKRSLRTLRASSCAEALDALALVATVMLDPAAALEPAPAPPGPGAGAAPSPAPADAASSAAGSGTSDSRMKPPPRSSEPNAGGRSKPARAATTRRRPRPKAKASSDAGSPFDPLEPETGPSSDPAQGPEPSREPSSRSGPARLTGSLGAAVHALSAPAPGLLPGLGLYAELVIERGALWSPSARLVAAHFQRAGFEAQGGMADFTLDALAVEACPLRLGPTRLALRPCAAASVGWLEATGVNTIAPETARRPWWTLGLAAIASVYPLDALEITATATVARPLIRDAFRFRSIFHRVPPLSASATVGVGVRFQ